MIARSIELVRRPEARTDSVEDLVAAVLRGEVRIPAFQRGLEWQTKHVLELFDSVYRGFPIGSLLLRRAPADAGPVHIGPVAVFGTETRSALWVIDGQQRLTSLVAGLGRPKELPTTPDDPFVVYFDPVEQRFDAPPRRGELPSSWVPVPQLLDGAKLLEWMFSWSHGREDELRRVVFEAGRRLREYRVPLYVIESDDEDAVRAIFQRVNSSGKPLKWTTVHDALYGHKSGPPATLAALAGQLEELGIGVLAEETLLPCLLAVRGLDVTRSFGEHIQRNPTVLEGAAAEALPVLRSVLGFLRVEAEIPHLRLLPSSAPLVVLTRLFTLHPEPNERCTTLLVRWVWRAFLSRDVDERTLKRRGVASIDDDLEASVQRLLELVSHDGPATGFVAPNAFDARAAQSRLALLGMASCKPRRLGLATLFDTSEDLREIDVAELIEKADLEAFRPMFPLTRNLTSGPENRLLLPGSGAAFEKLQSFIHKHGADHPVLASHLITPTTAQAILHDDVMVALNSRMEAIDGAVDRLGKRLAEWGRSDRPSLEYLLAQVADE